MNATQTPLTKQEATKIFKEHVLHTLPYKTPSLIRQMWAYFKYQLYLDQEITQKQYETWTCPF